jgi:hypothetical protein
MTATELHAAFQGMAAGLSATTVIMTGVCRRAVEDVHGNEAIGEQRPHLRAGQWLRE